MFAKLVGEGYENPHADSDLPLDVNYAKIAEWLVSWCSWDQIICEKHIVIILYVKSYSMLHMSQLDRRLVSSDWPKKLQLIQSKTREAAKDLSPGLINQLRTTEDGAVLDYFDAKDILGKLMETAERGLLGSLTGAAGTWERVVKAYESTLLQVAEGGMTLSRYVDYEIPYLKKQASKNQQLITDLDKRSAEAIKSADQSAAEFREECEKFGIPPVCANTKARMRAALVAKAAQEVPGKIKDAVDLVVDDVSLGQAMSYYATFVKKQSLGMDSLQQLVTLAEVREGRTPEIDSLHGETGQPNADEVTGLETGAAMDERHQGSTSALRDSIQWDIEVSETGLNAEKSISWDVDVDVGMDAQNKGNLNEEVGDDQAARQDWKTDFSVDVAIEDQGVDGSSNVQELDVGIGMPDATLPAVEKDFLENILSPAAKRILHDASYRAMLLDDLFELQSFLSRRHSELISAQDTLQPTAHHVDDSVEGDDAESVLLYMKSVDRAIELLTEERMMQLLSILSSSVYVEQIVSKFLRKAGQEGKFRAAVQDAEHRKLDAQRQLMGDSAKLAALIRRTKRIKMEIESALRAKLHRPVNIQGEINVVLNSANLK